MLLIQAAGGFAAERATDQGIGIAFDVDAPDGAVAGADARLSFHISDIASGRPLNGAKPAAWLSMNRRGTAPDDTLCNRKVAAFVSGNALARPDVDLTGFALAVMNRDPSVSILDPQGGYRGSRTITEIALDSPGGDWAVLKDPPRLFVTEPGARKIAAIDTERWRRIGTIATQDPPGAILARRDGRVLFAVSGASLIAFDTATLAETARLPLGQGAHRLVLSGDGRFLLVTSDRETAVSAIDAMSLAKVRDIGIGAQTGPASVSALAGAIYLAAGDAILAIDPSRDAPIARIDDVPDVAALGIEPRGRWGFAASPARNEVTIFDTTTNRVVRRVPVADGPREIAFTETQAYVRRRDSEAVTMIPLGPIEAEGGAAGLAEFPAGEKPGGAGPGSERSTASMVASPGESSMLLANPGGGSVAYYHEGMAAPADGFDVFGHRPEAVAIVDHGLRQTGFGTYGATIRLPPAGTYDVAVLLDQPRIAHCFALTVAPPAKGAAGETTIEPLDMPRVVAAGKTVSMGFRVTGAAGGKDVPPIGAITALAILAPGTWFGRVPMTRTADGAWHLAFTPPHPGYYMLAFEAPGQGLSVDTSPHFTFEAKAMEAPRE